MESEDREKREKGDETEKRFKEWLDKHSIPYLYIKQDTESISSSIKRYFHGKRPDFMLLIPNLGFIFVDVKYKKLSKEYNSFPLDSKDTKQLSSVQRSFNLQIWYSISNEEYGFNTWFWIPVSKVLEEGDIRNKNRVFKSGKSKEDFFAVPINKFIQISFNDSLDRLFSKIFIN